MLRTVWGKRGVSLDIAPQLVEFAEKAQAQGLPFFVGESYALVGYRQQSLSDGGEPDYYCVNAAGEVIDSRKGIILQPETVVRLLTRYLPYEMSEATSLVAHAIADALAGHPRVVDL